MHICQFVQLQYTILTSAHPVQILYTRWLHKCTFKGIHWQLDKLGLNVVFCLDKNDGESHFAELGSCWPGEAKTWPKIVLRVGGRAEYSVLEDERPNSVLPPVPQRSTFPPVLQHVALFLATFWPLLASWSRVRQNDLYDRFRLGQTELLRPTCKISNGSL